MGGTILLRRLLLALMIDVLASMIARAGWNLLNGKEINGKPKEKPWKRPVKLRQNEFKVV